MGQPVGPLFELRVAHHLPAALDGHRVATALGLLLEQLVQAGLPSHRHRRFVPPTHHLPPLLRPQQPNLPHPNRRIRHHAPQHLLEVTHQPLDCLPLEQVRRVLEVPLQPSARLRHEQRQIELRRLILGLYQADLEPWQRQRFLARTGERRGGALSRAVRGAVAVGHLEDRVARKVAIGTDLLDQLLEGEIGVDVGIEHRLAHLAQVLGEGLLGMEACSQHQRVHEHADQPLGLDVVAVTNGIADAEVPLAAVSVEQHVEGGGHGHEQRHLLAPAELAQASAELLAEVELEAAAVIARAERPGMVGRQLEGAGGTVEAAAEEVEVFGERLPAQPAVLPLGEVGVLDGQLGQRRRPAVTEGAVEGAQLRQQHVERPAVGGDVMHGELQDVLLRRKAHEAGPQQGSAGEVEGVGSVSLEEGRGLRVRVRLGGDVGGAESERAVRLDHLDGRAVLRGEGGAQDLVPADDLVEAALERRGVEARRAGATPPGRCRGRCRTPAARGTTCAAARTTPVPVPRAAPV